MRRGRPDRRRDGGACGRTARAYLVCELVVGRVAVDPAPGPRGRSAFDGLRPVGRWNAAVTPASRPRQPASLLPAWPER
jgi:hypothetical protein